VVESAPGVTEVTVVSDVSVVGVLAQFGRGMIQDVGDQLFQKFTDGLRRELETPVAATPPDAAAGPTAQAAMPETADVAPAPTAPVAPAPPSAATAPVLDVGSLGAAAVGRAAARTLRRPGFWVALLLLVLALWALFG
jgi:uncharacterized protein